MNEQLGTIVTAMITDKNEQYLFAQKEGVTYKVVDEEVEKYEIGDMIEGFVYVNQKDENVLMTEIPPIHANAAGWGEVVAVQHELGVFVDVGWVGKDLAISLDALPAYGTVWPRKGDRLYVTAIQVDDKNRMWGKIASLDELLKEFKEGTKEMHNENMSGTVTNSLKVGSYVALEDGYIGFIHPRERDEEPRLGQHVEGRVIGLREDGVIYMSLRPRAHEVIDEDASMLHEIIRRADDFKIPYHNKSDPEDIRAYFGISKAQFKRAVGRLMKHNIVQQDAEGTYLTDEAREKEL